MAKLIALIRSLARDEKGQDLIEYRAHRHHDCDLLHRRVGECVR